MEGSEEGRVARLVGWPRGLKVDIFPAHRPSLQA